MDQKQKPLSPPWETVWNATKLTTPLTQTAQRALTARVAFKASQPSADMPRLCRQRGSHTILLSASLTHCTGPISTASGDPFCTQRAFSQTHSGHKARGFLQQPPNHVHLFSLSLSVLSTPTACYSSRLGDRPSSTQASIVSISLLPEGWSRRPVRVPGPQDVMPLFVEHTGYTDVVTSNT